jgi:hypothetical protein
MFCVTIPEGMTWAGGIELTVGWIPIAAAAATALVGLAVGMGRAVRVSRTDRADKQVTTFRCSTYWFSLRTSGSRKPRSHVRGRTSMLLV